MLCWCDVRYLALVLYTLDAQGILFMKRYISIAIIAFWSCFSVATFVAAAEPEFVIGFPEDNMANDWRAAQVAEIKRELGKYPNVKFLVSDAKGIVAQNIIDIERMVKQGAQLLFLAPRKPDAVELVVSRLRKQGIYIVLLTRKLNSNDFDAYVSPDDFKIAYEAAIFLAEEMGGSGRVLMLEGVPTTTTAIRRKSGFLAGLNNYPGINVIAKTANYSRAEAVKVVGSLLKDGLEFDTIYAHNDAMLVGARIALKHAGIAPSDKPSVGIDFLPEARQAILKGEQLASFTYPTCGKIGVSVALDLLNGKQVKRFIPVPSQLVTRENVNTMDTAF